MARLQGKRTIVTGAGSGIGRASSKAFAREGAAVLCVDKTEAVHETVEMILKAGGRAIGMTADAGVEDDVRRYVGRAISELGGVDAIYANAGISGGYVPIVDQTVEQWQEILRVNLIGPFLAIKHVAPLMVAQKQGSIICTASVAVPLRNTVTLAATSLFLMRSMPRANSLRRCSIALRSLV